MAKETEESAPADKNKQETVKAQCPSCKGSGFTTRARETFCPSCKGSGTVSMPQDETEPCRKCEGEGYTEHGHCAACSATGNIVKRAVSQPNPK